MDDERFYEIVAREVASGQLRPGLWAKAVAQSAGDDKAAKALYLKLRAEQLRGQGRKQALGDAATAGARGLGVLTFWFFGAVFAVLAALSVLVPLSTTIVSGGEGAFGAFIFAVISAGISAAISWAFFARYSSLRRPR